MQSANATNSDSDRAALQAEVTQLVGEINRVANQTSFNGTKLLDGSFASQLFQVGADAGQTISINSIVDANSDKLGSAQFAGTQTLTGGNGTTDIATTDTTVSGYEIEVTDAAGVAKTYTLDDFTVKTGESYNSAIAAAINGRMDETGVYAEITTAAEGSTDGVVTLSSVKAGQTFEVGGTPTFMDTAATPAAVTVVAALTAGTPASTALDTAVTIKDIDVTSALGSQQALEIVDKALTKVNSARADLGAVQNRFTSTIANLSASSENISAAKGRITDADFASETASLTRAQILQQAGTAMLAQANSLPQNVLSLLR